MVFGISGKINSGKDTVGKIIQILTDSPHFTDKDVKGFLKRELLSPKFINKKFADKLKDNLCSLIGCTREQLEDETFKSKELGEEWWYFKGRNGSLISYSEGSKRSDEDLIKTTPRLLLQLLGTDCGRDIIHPNIWVNALMSEYKPLYGYQTTNSKITIGDISIPIPGLDIDKRVFPNWIITDMRFPNELEAVKSRGGITIRVNRPCEECGMIEGHKLIPHKKQDSTHPSETALDNAEFDYIINNDSTIEDLIHTVSLILKREKII